MVKEFKPHLPRLLEARPELQPRAVPGVGNDMFGPVESKRMPPVRRNVLFLSGTEGVSPEEMEAIEDGLNRIRQEVQSRIGVNNLGKFVFDTEEYGSTEWYQQKALLFRDKGFGRQVDVNKVLSLLAAEPYRRKIPHLEVMIFDKDLTTVSSTPDNNFVYGLNRYPVNFISTRRLSQRIGESRLGASILSIVAAHELGHNFGLVNRNFNVGQGSYKGLHCNGERGPCLMEQVDVPGCPTIVAQARKLINRATWLCQDCINEAYFKKDHLESHGVLW